MSELLIVYNKRYIYPMVIASVIGELARNRPDRKIMTISSLGGPDLRLFDLDKLPEAEVEEIMQVVKGVVTK
jgi:hypothetical protein